MKIDAQTTNFDYQTIGNTFIVDPKDMVMLVRPKWWKKEITLPLWGWFLICMMIRVIHDLVKWAIT